MDAPDKHAASLSHGLPSRLGGGRAGGGQGGPGGTRAGGGPGGG